MSIANKILDSKYLGHMIERTPDGRNLLIRRWQIDAVKTNPTELESVLFQAYGTADGVDTSVYSFAQNTDKIFADHYLIRQNVKEQRRGVEPAQYVLEKTYEQADATLKLLTDPLVQTEADGRRFAQTKHIVLTSAWEAGTLAGTLGVTAPPAPYSDSGEDLENFRLQKERTETEGFVLTTVVRDWVEATTTAVRVGNLSETRGPDNLRKLNERLIQLASEAEVIGTIGTTVLGGTTAILFSQKSEADKSVRVIDKEWAVPGTLSDSTEYRHNDKLALRTVRAFGEVFDTPEGWILTSTTVENPNGFAIRTYNFAQGEGEISRKEGRLHGGRLTTLRIDYLTEPDYGDASGEENPVETPEGYFAEPYEVNVDEAAGYKRWQATFIKGSGIINVTTQERHNEKLTLTTVEYVTEPDAAKPTASGYGIETGSSSQRQPGYTIWRLEFADGEGEIGRSTSQRVNGVVEVTDIKVLTLPSVMDAPSVSAAPGELADESWEDREGYKLWTLRYVEVTGTGIVFDETQTRFNDALKLRTIRRVNAAPDTPEGWAEIASGETERELWTEHSATYALGLGEVSRTTGERIKDVVEVVDVAILSDPDTTTAPTPNPAISGDPISTGVEDKDGHRLWTLRYVVVTAGGVISTDDQIRNNGALLLRTIRRVNTEPDHPEGWVKTGEGSTKREFWTEYTATFALGEGEISRRQETSLNGKMEKIVARIITAGDEGSTSGTEEEPVVSGVEGYVQVSSSRQESEGHVVWDLEYVLGEGEISRQTGTRQGGKLETLSVRYLTAPGASEPTPTGTGTYTEVSSGSQEADGHLVWTFEYAKGNGRISTRTATRNGTLTETTIRFLGVDDGATPSGVLVSTETEQRDGHTITTASYVSGTGEISRDINYRQSSDEGVTGITVTRIRHLTLIATGTDPTSLLGSVKIGEDRQDQDGYRIWTVTYAKGTGEISRSENTRNNGGLETLEARILTASGDSIPTADGSAAYTQVSYSSQEAEGHTIWTINYAKGNGEISRRTTKRNNGKLKVVDVRYLTEPGGSQPVPSGLTTYALVNYGSQEADGHVIWNLEYALGDGLISDDKEIRNKGKLVIYARRQLSTAGDDPVTPSATIAGTVVEISRQEQDADGHIIVTKKWAEGLGIISQQVRARDIGIRTQTYVSLGTKETPAGVVVAEDETEENGVTRYTVTCVQSLAGASPVSGATPTLSTGAYVPFEYPGRSRAIAMEQQFGTGLDEVTKVAFDIQHEPPVKAMIAATVEVYYQTSSAVGALANPLWNPTQWATIVAQWVGWVSNAKSKTEAMRGHRAIGGSSTEFFEDAPSGYRYSVMGDRVYNGSNGFVSVKGGPDAPDGNTYTLKVQGPEPAFVDVDGTIYYRKILTVATIPAQPAMPDFAQPLGGSSS